MKEILITMNSSGSFDFNGNATSAPDAGRIEEYCAKLLKIKLNSDFLMSGIKYYTLSFEPYALSRKIITENIYRDSQQNDGIYFRDGYIYCPVYDYIAVSPSVMVQVDGYETDNQGNVKSIIKSGIFTIEFSPSLTGEGMMVETVRPDVKFYENVENAVSDIMKTQVIDGANLKKFSVTGNKIDVLTITSENLKDDSVTSAKIALNAVKEDNLADGSVTAEKLAQSSVTGEKIVEDSITTSKIVDKNVTSAKIADGAVLNTKLADYSVSETKLRPLSVTTAKIKDGSVTPSKLDRTYLTHHQSLQGYATQDWVNKQNFVTDISGKADKEDLPEKLSELRNDIAVTFIKQNLTDGQKNVARNNIGAVSSADIENKADYEDLPKKLSDLENDIALTFSEQNLTDEQKNTVLQNIGAVKKEEGKILSSNDFTDEEKEKLSCALTEHQDISMKADKDDLSTVAFSGSYNDLENLPDLESLKCSFNDELKENYDEAYLHSQVPHAPAVAEENVINKILLNGSQTEIKNKCVELSVITYEKREPVFAEVYK